MTTIRPASNADAGSWLELRHALWPDGSREEHRREIEAYFAGTLHEPLAVLLAELNTQIIGLAELSIRTVAEGCYSGRIAFLEGWYVVPEARRLDVGRTLIAAAERWSVEQGCTEFASDTQIDNEISRAAHRRCGFEEVAVIRCFRKELPGSAGG